MIALGLTWYVVFLFSTTLHEAAHAWSAMRMGDLTAYGGGQVSLNPQPHIKREPIGMVVVPIIFFLMSGGKFMVGWASAPYNANWANRYPKRAALMSLAGPAANFLLVLVSALLIRLGLTIGAFHPPEQIGEMASITAAVPGASALAAPLAIALSVMFSLNLLLGIFNLLPLPPLDGSGVLTMFMSHEGALKYRMYMSSGMLPLIGLVVAWQLLPAIYFPARLFMINVLYFGITQYQG